MRSQFQAHLVHSEQSWRTIPCNDQVQEVARSAHKSTRQNDEFIKYLDKSVRTSSDGMRLSSACTFALYRFQLEYALSLIARIFFYLIRLLKNIIERESRRKGTFYERPSCPSVNSPRNLPNDISARNLRT